nr:MAG TPA: hypothetical protein [Inoviridae sp.]
MQVWEPEKNKITGNGRHLFHVKTCDRWRFAIKMPYNEKK